MSFGSFLKKAKKSIGRAAKKYAKVAKKLSPKSLYDDTTGRLVHKFIPGAAPYIDAGAQLGAQALAGSIGIPPQLSGAALALDSTLTAQHARGGVAQPLATAPGELPAGVNNAATSSSLSGFALSPTWIGIGLAGAAALLLMERRK